MSEWIGHFHPLLVHLPIGFIILLATLEVLALFPRWRNATSANTFIVALTFPVSVGAVVCGWLLAESGGYDAATLFWHRWLGVGVAVASGALLWFQRRGWQKAYRWGVWASLVLLTVASHLGGTLTHGADFLAWPSDKSSTKNNPSGDRTTQPVFAGVVKPLLDKYCVECHGPKKSKGGLKLDTAEHVLKGSDNGPVIDTVNPENSSFLKLILLPPDHDDHMPPDGKPQPTENEIAIIRWWINSGAPTDKTPAELNAPENIMRLLKQ